MIRFLRSSLFYQSFKIGVILVAFLFLLFIIFPNKVFFTAKAQKKYFEYIDCTIEKLDMTCSEIRLDSINDDLFFSYYGNYFVVNGKEYYSFSEREYCFHVTSRNGDKYKPYIVLGDPLRRSRFTYTIFNNAENHSDNISMKKSTTPFMGDELNMETGPGEWSIRNVDNDNFIIIIRGCKLGISTYEETYEEIVEDDEIQIEVSDISSLVPMQCIVNTYRAEIDSMSITHIGEENFNDCPGNISVFYKAKPEEYEFIDTQELNIHSRDKSITASVSKKNEIENNDYLNNQNTILYSGYADDINLSQNSLMPSFTNMIKENVYTLPTILVSMIVGAIALVWKKEENGQDIEEIANQQAKKQEDNTMPKAEENEIVEENDKQHDAEKKLEIETQEKKGELQQQTGKPECKTGRKR